MFERFTERARQVVVLAQEEAEGLKHNYIGTEHILLGLLREEAGIAVVVLNELGITADTARAQVVRIVGSGGEAKKVRIPLTPQTKKVMELALHEALSLGHNYIGTEHILLGLIREDEGVAAHVLLNLDTESHKIRGAVMALLRNGGGPGDAQSPQSEKPGHDSTATIAAPAGDESTSVGFRLSKAARFYVVSRLGAANNLCGFEQELLEALRKSQCTHCGGSGLAAYVGGDDDGTLCDRCKGSGFNPDAQLSL